MLHASTTAPAYNFLDSCTETLGEASSCADGQLDALAVEFLDALYGPGVGRSIWAVVGRMANRRAKRVTAIERAIEAERS